MLLGDLLHGEGSGRLTPHPYFHDGTSFRRVMSGVKEDGQVWCAPPEELLRALDQLPDYQPN